MNEIKIRKPDDWHLHLRDGEALKRTVPDVASHIHRAIIMPNLLPPITDVASAVAYRERILQHSNESTFTPLMTLYLTDNLTPEEIEKAAGHADVVACKLYPAGATTHSDAGISDLSKCGHIFEAMQKHGLKLLVHGEVTSSDIDIFDREKVFIDRHLSSIIKTFPKLSVVMEHITTKDAVDFILASPEHVAATITVHHLLLDRNDLLAGGVRPDLYCLPILKRQSHQTALREVVLKGHPRFFFGSDSAPHTSSKKYTACGCAGIYTAPVMMPLLAEFFEAYAALERLAPFVSEFGAQFYGYPLTDETITLIKKPWAVPDHLPLDSDLVTPLYAGKTLRWQVQYD